MCAAIFWPRSLPKFNNANCTLRMAKRNRRAEALNVEDRQTKRPRVRQHVFGYPVLSPQAMPLLGVVNFNCVAQGCRCVDGPLPSEKTSSRSQSLSANFHGFVASEHERQPVLFEQQNPVSIPRLHRRDSGSKCRCYITHDGTQNVVAACTQLLLVQYDGYTIWHALHLFLNIITRAKSDEVTLWQLTELLHEGVHTRVFFWGCVHDNPHSQALQNGITTHRHNFLHLRIVRRVDGFQCAVIRLFLVRAIRAWCFFSLLYHLQLNYNTCYEYYCAAVAVPGIPCASKRDRYTHMLPDTRMLIVSSPSGWTLTVTVRFETTGCASEMPNGTVGELSSAVQFS